MKLSQLKQFQAIARYGSMNLAAEKLYISQSAISQNIKSLENELGVKLFDRSAGGKMEINLNGRKLYYYADKMLSLEKETLEVFGRPHEQSTLILVSGGGRLFAPLIGDYHQHFSNTQIKTFVNARYENIKQLLSGQADVLIDAGFIDEPEVLTKMGFNQYISNDAHREEFCRRFSLVSYLFYPSNLYLCVNPQSKYAKLSSISMTKLSEVPIIRTNYIADFEAWIDALAYQYGITYNTTMVVDSDTYHDMVFAGGGSTLILSTFLINEPRFLSDCKLIPVDSPLAERVFYVYARKDNTLANHFLDYSLRHFDWTLLLRES